MATQNFYTVFKNGSIYGNLVDVQQNISFENFRALGKINFLVYLQVNTVDTCYRLVLNDL